MPQKRVTKPLQSPKPAPTGSPLVAPFPGTIGTYHSIPLIWIPLIWTLSLQSFSKVSPRIDLGQLSRLGQDHSSSRESHPKLRKRRPWTLGRSSIPDPKSLPPIQQEVAREIWHTFPHFFMVSGSRMKESFGPRKENNSLKGPC